MTRFWIGAGLLIGLLAGCLGVTWEMQSLHQPVCRNLEQAAQLAQEGDPAQAEVLAVQAHERWQRRWHFAAAFADHSPMEEIDALFGALEAYPPDSEEFAACCLQLVQRTQAMAQAHALNWWNLL